jgi:hypothetical protein
MKENGWAKGTVKEILKRLRELLPSHDEFGFTKIEAWLKMLLNTPSINDIRLAYSILIDVKRDENLAKMYFEVLSNLDASEPRLSISKAIANLPNKHFHFLSSKAPALQDNESYSKVMSLDSFLHYVGRIQKVRRIRSVQLDRWNHGGAALLVSKEKIQNYGWSSLTGLVWVTPFSEICSVLDSTNDLTKADAALIHLGLQGIKSGTGNDLWPEMVLIRYPPAFPDACYQPSALNKDWQEVMGQYLSYGANHTFGKTYHESDHISFANERIHLASTYFSEDFKAISLGKSSNNSQIETIDVHRLLIECTS